MKYTAGILALIGSSSAEPVLNRSTRQIDQERRYNQLTDMMEHYNADFDERKYWTYGCNCLILGDRPMSDPGHGPPVDALDTVCKAYKDCQKCARMEHGDTCIGEFVRYKYGEKNGDKFCKDTAGSCDRALCECDLQFAKAHVAKKHVFTTDYHLFWSTLPNGWDPKDNCPRGGGGPYDPQCCGKPDGPFVLFNAANRACCDGEVKKGQC
jgi:hypothetical protein